MSHIDEITDNHKNSIHIEIVYATPQQHIIMPVQLVEPCTIEQAIIKSGILQRYPEIQLENNKVGIFSKTVPLSTVLKDGDRVEIYRPLIIDPKQARLRRVIPKPKKLS